MLKDITLGQYFPGDTVAHRLDARTKLILVIVYIVALFQADSWAGYTVVTLVTLGCMLVSKIKPATMFKGVKPMLFIIALTALLNIFYTTGTPVRPGWIITWEGIARAVQMMLRIVLLISGTFLLTYTTSPIALTDGLELLLNPLKKLRVPVHEMTIMMSMALRFIPTLISETDKIMSAQKARGADFETGSLLSRAKALLPILVPLFVSAFKRADELAVAMESRCYHGGEGRTRMKQLRMEARDGIALGLGGRIRIKANSVTDRELIDKLSEASRAGVRIDLIIRGICCLLPGVQGKTENITVTSVVGRFLEHSRIYAFGEGPQMKLFLSSADFMTRNQDRRVEVGAPVKSPELKAFLEEYLNLVLKDNTRAWRQQPDGDYVRLSPGTAERVDVQAWYLSHPIEFAKSQAPKETLKGRLRRLLRR